MRGKHQVLTGAAAISDRSGNDDDGRRSPKYLEAWSFHPIPAGFVGTIFSRMVHRTRAIGGNSLNTFDDIESPGDLAAKGWRRLRRVEDQALDQVAGHWP
jgi:hypothetical protein